MLMAAPCSNDRRYQNQSENRLSCPCIRYLKISKDIIGSLYPKSQQLCWMGRFFLLLDFFYWWSCIRKGLQSTRQANLVLFDLTKSIAPELPGGQPQGTKSKRTSHCRCSTLKHTEVIEYKKYLKPIVVTFDRDTLPVPSLSVLSLLSILSLLSVLSVLSILSILSILSLLSVLSVLSILSPTISEELYNCLEHHAGSHLLRLLLRRPHQALDSVKVVRHTAPQLTADS